MTNTANRQQIEEVLAEFEGERISDALINDICSAIYRPPFQPKRGQVCWFSKNNETWELDKLASVIGADDAENRLIGYKYDGYRAAWRFARPLNFEELGE